MTGVYYNENEPYAAAWLRNLVAAGHLPAGDVDDRSIKDVRASDLAGYTQCHFFCGIAGWSLALRLAGWPDDRPVWTGSCPCQGFSAAGKGKGFDDERHLWPDWFRLIGECRPSVVFGEQVASPLALAWLDLVQSDMEGADYAVAAFDLGAAGIGAPHIRQRLWFVADAELSEGARQRQHCGEILSVQESVGLARIRSPGVLGHADSARLPKQRSDGEVAQTTPITPARKAAERAGTSTGGVGDAHRDGAEPISGNGDIAQGETVEIDGGSSGAGVAAWIPSTLDRPGPTNGFWRDADWLHCRDGKWRPVEPGTFPLAHGILGRVGQLRAYGNAIVPQVGAEFVMAYLAYRPSEPQRRGAA